MHLPAATFRAGLITVLLALAACSGPREPAKANAAKAATPEIAAAPGVAPIEGPTLKAVRARGRVVCGITQDIPGFAARDVLGQWRGFDIDICRAVAAAVFDDARQVRIERLDPAAPRYSLLQAGKVDLVARGGWTFKDDAGLGLNFAGVSFYDSAGFLVGKASKARKLDNLAGVKVCAQAGAANTLNLNEYFSSATPGKRPQMQVFDTTSEALEAYKAGRCQVLSGEVSMLSALRTQLRDPDRHMVVSAEDQLEPQGPVVRQDDSQWADIVRGTVQAMILAEDLGVGSRTAGAERAKPTRAETGRLLSGDGYGQMLLLRDDWAFQVIRQVGSYGEVFDRNLGPSTPLKMERGKNALWSAKAPGLLTAPPMR